MADHHSPSPSYSHPLLHSPPHSSSSSNALSPAPTYGTPSSAPPPPLLHAHSEFSPLPVPFQPPHEQVNIPKQPNAGPFSAANSNVDGQAQALGTQSMQSIPMGPPPGLDGSPSSQFASPLRYTGPPGPPVFTSPARPAPAYSAQARGPTNFSDIPLAPATPPHSANGYAVPAIQQGISEEEFDAYGLSASSPFLLFTAQTATAQVKQFAVLDQTHHFFLNFNVLPIKVLSEKKIMNTASLGFGALVCPGRVTVPGPPAVMHNAIRCQNCGAYVNLHCSIAPSTGSWSCTFCNKSNTSNGEYRAASRDDLRNSPELLMSVVDYVDSGTRRPGFISVSDTSMSAPVVLLIDDSLDEPHLSVLQTSLHSFLDSLSSATRIGIVTYGRTVSVYDLSETGVAAADVLPGNTALSQDLKQLLIYGTGVYLAPIHACLSTAHSVVSALRPYRGDLPEAARDRCLGTGVEVVLALIQGPSIEVLGSTAKRSGGRSRVLLCVGGPNTLGPGSLPPLDTHPNFAYLERKATKHMEDLGQEARRLDIALDVLCAGTCPIRIPTLQPLAKASGGVLVLHDDFGEVFCLNLQRSVQRSTGFRGILEVRCSDDVAITRVIGPGEEVHGDGASELHYRNDTSTAVRLLSLEDCQAFAIVMELQEDLEVDHVYFQISARFTSIHQAEVTRVVTARLPTTSSISNYLNSVDDEVAAVLIAKKTVLEAKTARDAVDMRASVDERLKDIAVKLGNAVPKSKLRSFPASLARLPELLFHLRRGPLLGGIIGHEDERAMYRSLYLQAGFDLSLRMLAPRLLMHQEAGTFEELPAYDLAMQSDSVIALDHGTDFFIWMGMDIAANEARSEGSRAACSSLAHELTEQRFPAPRVLAFKEASSQARYLQARLIPAHKDPPHEQEARFPQILSLGAEQRARLKNSFVPTDDLSFCEWMRSLRIVPP